MGWGLPGILRYLPSPTIVPVDHLGKTFAQLAPNASVLDVGAGGRRVVDNVTAFDAVAMKGVDVVGDIHQMPFDDNSFDCVVCTGTLEHVADPWKAIREIRRVLKPGGIVHVDVPFMQAYHADPTDYWRFTIDGLCLLCGDFTKLEAGVHIGPTCAVVWSVREWANSLSHNRYLSNMFLIPVALLTAPFKYIDYIAVRCQRAHRVASAVYFRGQKIVNELPVIDGGGSGSP